MDNVAKYSLDVDGIPLLERTDVYLESHLQKGTPCIIELSPSPPQAEKLTTWIEEGEKSLLPSGSSESLYFEQDSSKTRKGVLKLVEPVNDKDFSKHLIFACSSGKLEAVQLVLTHSNTSVDPNASVSCHKDQSTTPLCVASLFGKQPVCELLIKSGADVNKADGQNRSPLHWAALAPHPGTARMLLEKGATLDSNDSKGLLPLHYGCYKGHASVVQTLLSGQSSVLSRKFPQGITPLMVACIGGHTEVVKILAKHSGSDCLFSADDHGLTPLHHAVWGGSIKCLKVLLSLSSWKAGLKQRDHWGRTPCITAAAKGDPSVCQFLLKKGGELMEVDKDGRSMLHWAVLSGQLSCVEFLLQSQKGVKLCSQKDCNGVTPLHLAAVKRQQELVVAILEKGQDPALIDLTTTASEHTAMVWAAACGWLQCVDIFVQISTTKDTAIKMRDGRFNALHAASSVGATDICKILLSAHFKVDDVSDKGLSPFHYACQYGHADCMRELIKQGANVEYLSPEKESGLHLAVIHGHTDVVKELLEKKVLRDKPLGVDQNCPVHLACIHGHSEALLHLLSAGSSPNTPRGRDGHTPFFLAASNGHLDCCKVLMEHGADGAVRMPSSSEGLTALDIAMKQGHTECVDYLLACHVPSAGGVYHRAAATLQAVWRYHRHKRYKRVTSLWAAMTLQRAIRAWLCRRRACRVKKARLEALHRAASIIQHKWKLYISERRRYEATYAKLKNRLMQEQLATSLIVAELRDQTRSISLPSASLGTRQTLAAGQNIKLHLFKTSTSGDQSTVLHIPKPQAQSRAAAQSPLPNIKLSIKKSLPKKLPQIVEQKKSTERVVLSELATVSLPSIPDDHRRIGNPKDVSFAAAPDRSAAEERLPPIPTNNTFAKHEGDKSLQSEELTRRDAKESSLPRTSKAKSVASPTAVKVPANSRLHQRIHRTSIFKDAPIGYKPFVSRKEPTGNISKNSTAATASAAAESGEERYETRQLNFSSSSPLNLSTNDSSSSRLNSTENLELSIDGSSVQSSSLSNHFVEQLPEQDSSTADGEGDEEYQNKVLNQVERFERLVKVLSLLKEARSLEELEVDGSGDSDAPGINSLRTHIESALNEAVKLRSEVDDMHMSNN